MSKKAKVVACTPFCQLIAEFIGTLMLVWFGCGSVALTIDKGMTGLGIAIAFGAVVMILIYALGHISGAHFNPAVTISFALVKRFSWKRVPSYIFAQMLGATAGAALVRFFWGLDGISVGVTRSADLLQGSVAEFFLSFLLMFVITSVATDSRAVGELAGLAIGVTVGICALVGGPICGASMNPARSLGPALISGDLINIWMYLSVPVLGMMAGVWVYNLIRCEACSIEDDSHGCC